VYSECRKLYLLPEDWLRFFVVAVICYRRETVGYLQIPYSSFSSHPSQFINGCHFPIRGCKVDEAGKVPWSKLETLADAWSLCVRAGATASCHWHPYCLLHISKVALWARSLAFIIIWGSEYPSLSSYTAVVFRLLKFADRYISCGSSADH
jgi:hypothetical protein